MEEVIISTIAWTAPEYNHKNRTADFLWSIGITTLAVFLIALWFANYLFAIFVLISGGCLIMFSIREPQNMSFIIQKDGFFMGKDKYEWKTIKGFHFIEGHPYSKLLIETSKYFLPVYTIPIPPLLVKEAKEELLKLVPNVEIKESGSMAFAEKLGF